MENENIGAKRKRGYIIWGNYRVGATKAKLRETLERKVKTYSDFKAFWKDLLPNQRWSKLCSTLKNLEHDKRRLPYGIVNPDLVNIFYMRNYEFYDLRSELRIANKVLALLGFPPHGVRRPKEFIQTDYYGFEKAAKIISDCRVKILYEIWQSSTTKNHRPSKQRPLISSESALVDRLALYFIEMGRVFGLRVSEKEQVEHACETASELIKITCNCTVSVNTLRKQYINYMVGDELWDERNMHEMYPVSAFLGKSRDKFSSKFKK